MYVCRWIAELLLMYKSMVLTNGNIELFIKTPSGQRLHNHEKKKHVQWVNQLFLWPFSIANCNKLPEGTWLEKDVLNPFNLELNHLNQLNMRISSQYVEFNNEKVKCTS